MAEDTPLSYVANEDPGALDDLGHDEARSLRPGGGASRRSEKGGPALGGGAPGAGPAHPFSNGSGVAQEVANYVGRRSASRWAPRLASRGRAVSANSCHRGYA